MLRSVIRRTFVLTVFIAVLSDLAGTLISLISSEENDTKPLDLSIPLYIAIFLSAAILASAEGYEKEKFNGPAIEGYESDSDSDSDDEKQVAIVTKPSRIIVFASHVLEAGFLTLSSILVAGDDFFTYAAVKAWFQGLIYSTDVNSLVSLRWYEITLLSAAVLTVDLPFELSNEVRSVSKYIKKTILGADDNLLIDYLLKPFAHRPGIAWVRSLGSFNSTLKRTFGILLNIPPVAILKIYKNKYYFGLFLAGGATILLPMSVFGFMQMYLFEGASSEKNLRLIRNNGVTNEEEKLLKEEKFQWPTSVVKVLKFGMYTQAPIYGFNAAKSPSILLRYFLKGLSTETQIAIIAPVAVFQFIFNAIGAQLSEVQEAIGKLKKMELSASNKILVLESSKQQSTSLCDCFPFFDSRNSSSVVNGNINEDNSPKP